MKHNKQTLAALTTLTPSHTKLPCFLIPSWLLFQKYTIRIRIRNRIRMMDSSCLMSYGMMSEQGDSSSAEEVESPRSVVTAGRNRVGRWRRGRKMDRQRYINDHKEKEKDKEQEKEKNERRYLHSQVLRVKEEELQIGEYLMGDFGIYNINYVPDCYDPIYEIWSRTMLPASPLGTKNNY